MQLPLASKPPEQIACVCKFLTHSHLVSSFRWTLKLSEEQQLNPVLAFVSAGVWPLDRPESERAICGVKPNIGSLESQSFETCSRVSLLRVLSSFSLECFYQILSFPLKMLLLVYFPVWPSSSLGAK